MNVSNEYVDDFQFRLQNFDDELDQKRQMLYDQMMDRIATGREWEEISENSSNYQQLVRQKRQEKNEKDYKEIRQYLHDTNSYRPGSFCSLPDEILEIIFSYCGPGRLLSLGVTCFRMNEIVKSSKIWRSFCQTYCPEQFSIPVYLNFPDLPMHSVYVQWYAKRKLNRLDYRTSELRDLFDKAQTKYCRTRLMLTANILFAPVQMCMGPIIRPLAAASALAQETTLAASVGVGVLRTIGSIV